MSYGVPFNDGGESAELQPHQHQQSSGSWQNNNQKQGYSKYGNNKGNYDRNYSRNGNGSGYGNGSYNKNKFYNKSNEEQVSDELYKAYVGTGNKEAPSNILNQMSRLSTELEQFGYTCRTGGLEGPEEVFEKNTARLELHLPWKGFNEKESKFTFTPKSALAIAAKFHPTFNSLKPAIQTIIAKNVRLLLGKDLKSPALFVICWSEDGAELSSEKNIKTGNLGIVIAIAAAMHIPVFNLAKPDAEKRLKQYLGLPYVEINKVTEI